MSSHILEFNFDFILSENYVTLNETFKSSFQSFKSNQRNHWISFLLEVVVPTNYALGSILLFWKHVFLLNLSEFPHL
ncbi:hypothetical protein LEP1GSC072_0195 [Leptospira noguchii str. Bonito]|nr:hypothetical protein LEP1GSC072_0195 [Leptospira noguchii str. Bonito]